MGGDPGTLFDAVERAVLLTATTLATGVGQLVSEKLEPSSSDDG